MILTPMNRRSGVPHRRYAAIGAGIGVIAGLGTWFALGGAPDGSVQTAPVGDRVRGAANAFESGTHVYVGPDGRDLLPAAAQQRLEKQAAEASTPVFITVWDHSTEAGYYLAADAADQIAAEVDEQAVYVVYEGPGEGVVYERPEYYDGEIAEDLNGDVERRLSEIIASADGLEVSESDNGDPPVWVQKLVEAGLGALMGGVAFAGIAVLLGIAMMILFGGAGAAAGVSWLARRGRR